MSKQPVTEYYGHDHDELDGFFQKFCELKRENYDEAKQNFKKFKFGLQRHIVWEDEILFPIFEEKTGMHDNGPTAVMRAEHVKIKELLENLHKKVQRRDPESEVEEQELLSLLKQHNDKEETILYPAIDQMVSEEEKQKLYAAMDSVPPEKYMSCSCSCEH